jgi:DNA-binding transcriptional LysR family regulator
LADEAKPRWVGADDLSAGYWAGQDGTSPSQARLAGPAVHDILQLVETVALGKAVAFLPSSTQQRFPRPDIVYRPVTGLTPNVTAIAWPETSRSPAVAALVRSAAKIAAARADPGHQARPA